MDLLMKFSRLCCTECATVYFFPEDWCNKASVDGRSWQCPNGHGQHFGNGELDTLRRERDRLKQNEARLIEEAAEANRQRIAAQSERLKAERQTKRVVKRAQAAMCPCCNRHFANVEAHMKTQHPDVVKLPERKIP